MTTSSIGMRAGAVTVGGLSAPLGRTVKRASTRTFVPAVAVLELALGVDEAPTPHPVNRTVTTPPRRTARPLTFAG
jgi:hypothetical protein